MSTHEYDETPAPSRMWVIAMLLALVMVLVIVKALWLVMTWVLQ